MKVFIVDDDHLVRKGIISMMPWSDFELKVVGEAGNGKKALQFLESNQVDLLITDIAMPTMSGIDLVREVRKRYPHIWIVLLTFHQDFDYVQEALRLGVIDYIAKVELEQENMSEVLGRITKRIKEEKTRRMSEHQLTFSDRALLFIPLKRESNRSFFENWFPSEQRAFVLEMSKGCWILSKLEPFGEEEILQQMFEVLHLHAEWAVCKIKGIDDDNKLQLYNMLSQYVSDILFYDFCHGRNIYELDLQSVTFDEQAGSEKRLYELKEHWSSLDWVFDDERFRSHIVDLESLRPSAAKLESMFYAALMQWEQYTSERWGDKFDASELLLWVDWVDWIRGMREDIRSTFVQAQYSDEVVSSILKAVNYINRHLNIDLKLTEVAEEVHISRSYFSECFKHIVGKTFNEYIRDARLSYAETLLTQTNDPIYKISEKCGYPDEKYFSRLFRKKMGMLPSEMRKQHEKRERKNTI